MSRWDTAPAAKQPTAKVYLGIPTHDGRVQNEIVNSVLIAGSTLSKMHIEVGSSLTFNFNTCYATALNNRKFGITHFAMLHSDIAVTQAGWCDRMVELAEEHGADLLSVAMRLKGDDGRTSTAIEEADADNPRNPLGFKCRKLTLDEIAARGKTWSDPALLVNTGLMLIDIRKPWADKIWFEFRDSIGCCKLNDGSGEDFYFPVSLSEDYGISRMVRAAGGKLVVTTEIPAIHCGGGRFFNQMPTLAPELKVL